MQFDSNRPIYLQILDSICEQILDGKFEPDGRILTGPSWVSIPIR